MKRILVVDDDPTFRRLMAELIRRAGYQVEEAKDGVEAINAINKRVPDLVVLDIVMPVMSGYEVMHHVRFDQHLPLLPIIVVTSKDRQSLSELSSELGVDCYNKNSSLKEIVEHIGKFFEKPSKAASKGIDPLSGEKIEDIKKWDRALWEREQRMIEDYVQESLRQKAERDKFLK